MSWPTTGAGTLESGYLAQGTTTIRWGTRELLQSTNGVAANFLVVTAFSERRLSDNIKLPNGDGLTSTRMIVMDGVQWDVTVRDDTRVADANIPYVGQKVTVVDAGGLLGSPVLRYTATVVEPQYEAAPKQPGQRTLTLERLRLIEPNQGGDVSGAAQL
jgi:hypothetical protein